MPNDAKTEGLWEELRLLQCENLWAMLDLQARGSVESSGAAEDLYESGLVPTFEIAKKIIVATQQHMRDVGFTDVRRIVRDAFIPVLFKAPSGWLDVPNAGETPPRAQMEASRPRRQASDHSQRGPSPRRVQSRGERGTEGTPRQWYEKSPQEAPRQWYEKSPQEISDYYARSGPRSGRNAWQSSKQLHQDRTQRRQPRLQAERSQEPRLSDRRQNSEPILRQRRRPEQSERMADVSELWQELTGENLGQAPSEEQKKAREDWRAAARAREGAEVEWRAAMQARHEAEALLATRREENLTIGEDVAEPESELPANEPEMEASPIDIAEGTPSAKSPSPASRAREVGPPRCYRDWEAKRQASEQRTNDFGQKRKHISASATSWPKKLNMIDGFTHMAFANSLRADGIDAAKWLQNVAPQGTLFTVPAVFEPSSEPGIDGDRQNPHQQRSKGTPRASPRQLRSASPPSRHFADAGVVPHYAMPLRSAMSRVQRTASGEQSQTPSNVAAWPSDSALNESELLNQLAFAHSLRTGEQDSRRPEYVVNGSAHRWPVSATAMRAETRVPRARRSSSAPSFKAKKLAFSTDFSEMRSGDARRVPLTSSIFS